MVGFVSFLRMKSPGARGALHLIRFRSTRKAVTPASSSPCLWQATWRANHFLTDVFWNTIYTHVHTNMCMYLYIYIYTVYVYVFVYVHVYVYASVSVYVIFHFIRDGNEDPQCGFPISKGGWLKEPPQVLPSGTSHMVCWKTLLSSNMAIEQNPSINGVLKLGTSSK